MNQIVKNAPIKIELKKLLINERGSQETTNYVADVYIDGKKAFCAHNEGSGGADFYTPYDDGTLLKKAEAYAKTLPPMPSDYFPDGLTMDLELLIAEMIEDHRKHKYMNSMMKKAAKHTVFALPDKPGQYSWITEPRTTDTDAYVLRKYPNAIILKPEEIKVG
jgi:hypothetical protein